MVGKGCNWCNLGWRWVEKVRMSRGGMAEKV